MSLRRALLLAVVAGSMLAAVLPILVNGAPMVGDSWDHLGIARRIASSGRYSMGSYNEFWPLVNMLLAFYGLVAAAPQPLLYSLIPFLVGLSSIPLILASRLLSGRPQALLSPLLLFGCLLFSFTVFAGSIMKETAAYYPALLSAYLILRPRTPRAALALSWLAVVLGHHFAGLFLSLLAVSCLFFCESRTGVAQVAVLLLPAYIAWNAGAVSVLGEFFPAMSATGAATLLLVYSGVMGALWFARRPAPALLLLSASLLAAWGLRGGLLALLRAEPPVTVWEAKNYALYAILALGGYWGAGPAYALAASSSSLVLFSLVWGRGYESLVLLTKSLHYLAAAVAAVSPALLSRAGKRALVASALVAALVLYEASYSGSLALRGLSAYRAWEVEGLRSLSSLLPGASSDTRLRYLAGYYGLGSGGPLLLSRVNFEEGFLLGYDWVPLSAAVGSLSPKSKLYDSALLSAWR